VKDPETFVTELDENGEPVRLEIVAMGVDEAGLPVVIAIPATDT